MTADPTGVFVCVVGHALRKREGERESEREAVRELNIFTKHETPINLSDVVSASG